MPLTDVKLRTLKPKAVPYKISDAEGLHLLVPPNGSKLWRWAYRYGGKQKVLALGRYPDVSLLDARRARDDARRVLGQGVDPAHAKKIKRLKASTASRNTFAAVTEEWFAMNQNRWVKTYSSRLRGRLDGDLLPALGSRPIAQIEPIEVLEAIRKKEKRDAIEMAKRVMQMASGIFRYGVATARCARIPPPI